MNKVNALLADKANTRLALATALVARNAECEALRFQARSPQPCKPWTRPAHMEAARQLAMSTQHVVRV